MQDQMTNFNNLKIKFSWITESNSKFNSSTTDNKVQKTRGVATKALHWSLLPPIQHQRRGKEVEFEMKSVKFLTFIQTRLTII